MEQWIDFASFEIDNNAMRWIGPRLGMGTFDKEVILSICINFFLWTFEDGVGLVHAVLEDELNFVCGLSGVKGGCSHIVQLEEGNDCS